MYFILVSPKVVTNTSAVISGLAACESYLFSVGLVGPLGKGPLGPPRNIFTMFNKNASPKKLDVTHHPSDKSLILVQWESSCENMTEAIGYEVSCPALFI